MGSEMCIRDRCGREKGRGISLETLERNRCRCPAERLADGDGRAQRLTGKICQLLGFGQCVIPGHLAGGLDHFGVILDRETETVDANRVSSGFDGRVEDVSGFTDVADLGPDSVVHPVANELLPIVSVVVLGPD